MPRDDDAAADAAPRGPRRRGLEADAGRDIWPWSAPSWRGATATAGGATASWPSSGHLNLAATSSVADADELRRRRALAPRCRSPWPPPLHHGAASARSSFRPFGSASWSRCAAEVLRATRTVVFVRRRGGGGRAHGRPRRRGLEDPRHLTGGRRQVGPLSAPLDQAHTAERPPEGRPHEGRERHALSRHRLDARTPIGHAYRGAFNDTQAQALGGHAIAQAVSRAGLDPAEVEDVVIGAALQQGAQGSDIARQCALRAGLPDTVPGMSLDRQCSSGLMAVATAAKQGDA